MADLYILEQNLKEVNEHILQTAREIQGKLTAGADWMDVDADMGHIDILFRRRRVILSAYANAGGRVAKCNEYGAYVGRINRI